MYTLNELEQSINGILDNDDTEKLETLINNFSSDNVYKFGKLMDNIDPNTRIKFYLYVMKYRKDNKKSIETKLVKNTIPNLLLKDIIEEEENFKRIINDKDDMKQIIIDYFKESPDNALGIWKHISEWPIAKSEILDDEEFVADKLKSKDSFFEELPEGYEHLICFYNSKHSGYDYNYLLPLYQRYYGEKIDMLQQIKLIYLQSNLKQNLGFSNYVQMQPLDFILKAVKKDPDFINTIEELSQKTELDFSNTAVLVYKYRDSKLLRELKEIEKIDEETHKKLEYLSDTNRIVGIDSIKDLQDKSIEELSHMDRELIYGANALGRGSPIAETMNSIFPGSSEREVRRIDKNGKIETMIADLDEGHEELIEKLYSDDVSFTEEYDDAFHRSIEAAKQISAVTLVIESEKCYIYLPSDLTTEQMCVCQELVDSTIQEGKFGIAVYDKEESDYYVETQSDLYDKENTKQFFKKLSERAKEKSSNEEKKKEEQTEEK